MPKRLRLNWPPAILMGLQIEESHDECDGDVQMLRAVCGNRRLEPKSHNCTCRLLQEAAAKVAANQQLATCNVQRAAGNGQLATTTGATYDSIFGGCSFFRVFYSPLAGTQT